MEASSTWQATFRQGEKQGEKTGERKALRKILLIQGAQRFGKPSEAIVKILKGTDDASLLEAMVDKILSASDWDDLIAK